MTHADVEQEVTSVLYTDTAGHIARSFILICIDHAKNKVVFKKPMFLYSIIIRAISTLAEGNVLFCLCYNANSLSLLHLVDLIYLLHNKSI